MCCKIELNNRQDAAHFLGKNEPNILPKSAENIAPADTVYTGEAVSLFDRLVAFFHQSKSS